MSLVPSAVFLWHNSDLPRFGDLHDDSLYYISAKSLADGGGYRIESLPGEPSQTKYPPLYPLLLSVAWHISPQFPNNLPIAAWISWLALPAIMLQLLWIFPRLGITGWRAWMLMTLIAVNPYMLVFSSTLVSELAFTALMLAAMLLTERAADRDGVKAAIAAGVCSGTRVSDAFGGHRLPGGRAPVSLDAPQAPRGHSLGSRDAAIRRRLDHLDAPAPVSHQRSHADLLHRLLPLRALFDFAARPASVLLEERRRSAVGTRVAGSAQCGQLVRVQDRGAGDRRRDDFGRGSHGPAGTGTALRAARRGQLRATAGVALPAQ